jgi:tetratricopeptide (TPR) repeat protein
MHRNNNYCRAVSLKFLLPIVFLFVLQAAAQNADVMTKLRLAQSFEQAGEWERAVSIYEALHEADSLNYVFFDGLRRGYTQLKEYSKAIELVQRRLRIQRADQNLLSTLGGLYFQMGDEPRADSLWHAVVNKDPKNSNLYRLVASQMIEHRQYDRAIQFYLNGRKVIGDAGLFGEDLASLYMVLQQYGPATEELVSLLHVRPLQLAVVEARLSSFTGRDVGRRAALSVVQAEVKRTPNDLQMQRLLAWLYMEGKEYDSALGQEQIIDRLSKAGGMELYQFAQRAMQEKAYSSAAKAFREVIDQSPTQGIVLSARFGYARAIEELSQESDTLADAAGVAAHKEEGVPAGRVSETLPSSQGAIRLYESIVAGEPNSELATQSLYRIGLIRFHRFFDLNGALAALEQARDVRSNANLSNEVVATIAEVRIAMGDLGRARGEYENLIHRPPGQQRDQALFHLAELDYFEANFDSATTKLHSITANVNTDLANDALQLLYFIQENKTTAPAALAAFAKAELLTRERKYSEALAQFEEVLKQYPTAPLVDTAMMKIGELQLLLNHDQEALALFRKIVDDMPTSILRDRAQMQIGEIYENRLKDKPKAIEAYEQVLIHYPTSLYLEEARRKIRLLRGDAL